MKEIKPHQLAEIFPQMSSGELSDLTESVKIHGLQHPIILFEGKILDGRHRYSACIKAGVKPRFDIYRGNDPIGLVVSANLHRRHLDTAQRAMIAARLVTTTWGGDRKNQEVNSPLDRTISDAAETMSVSEKSVKVASAILEEAPKTIVAQVDKGELSLNAAAQQMKAQPSGKSEPVLCETGGIIPAPLHALWARRGEILEMMRNVAKILNTITEGIKTSDHLLSVRDSQGVTEHLGNAHMLLRSMQLYALCPTCSGRNFKSCTHCRGRAFLNKQQYQLVPSESRALRERSRQ